MREEIGDFCGTCRFGRAHAIPPIGPVEVEDPFEACDMLAPAADEQKHRTALGITPLHYCRETAVGRGSAQDRADLDMGR